MQILCYPDNKETGHSVRIESITTHNRKMQHSSQGLDKPTNQLATRMTMRTLKPFGIISDMQLIRSQTVPCSSQEKGNMPDRFDVREKREYWTKWSQQSIDWPISAFQTIALLLHHLGLIVQMMVRGNKLSLTRAPLKQHSTLGATGIPHLVWAFIPLPAFSKQKRAVAPPFCRQ